MYSSQVHLPWFLKHREYRSTVFPIFQHPNGTIRVWKGLYLPRWQSWRSSPPPVQKLAVGRSAIENARLFAETQRLLIESEKRNTELSTINSLQLGLVSRLDMKGIYELVGENLRKIFGVRDTLIYSFDHEHRLVVDEYVYEKGRQFETLPQKMTSLHNRMINSGETLCIQKNAKEFFEEHQHPMPGGEMHRSFILVPFKTRGKVAGMIGLFDIDNEFAFSESDARLLETLTHSVAVALESAHLFTEIQCLLKDTEGRAGKLATMNMIQQRHARKVCYSSIGSRLST